MHQLFRKLQGDRVIWMVVFFLAIVSLISVYSSISTLAYKAHGNSFKFLIKHLAMLGIGIGVMYVVHKARFKYFSPLSQAMLWVAVVMLLLTLLVGSEINGAKRWLEIPFINMTFQSSDFAKIVLIVYTARMLNVKRTVLHNFKEGVLPILWPIALVCGLILPADFSTAVLLGGVCFLLLFIGGVPYQHLLKVLGLIIAFGGLLILLGQAFPELLPRFETWGNRIAEFVNPDDNQSGNFQSDVAQFAIWDGGLLPTGSSSSRNFLPHPYSDMIYAFIIQAWGSIIGGIGLMLLYVIFLFRSLKIAIKCPKHFGGLMVIGLSFLLTAQALFNMAVAVHLFPVTGQPLPLVSMGGTSTIFTCLSIGIILSVSRSVYNKEEYEAELSSQSNRQKASYAST